MDGRSTGGGRGDDGLITWGGDAVVGTRRVRGAPIGGGVGRTALGADRASGLRGGVRWGVRDILSTTLPPLLLPLLLPELLARHLRDGSLQSG